MVAEVTMSFMSRRRASTLRNRPINTSVLRARSCASSMMIAEYFPRSFCCIDSRSSTPSVISTISTFIRKVTFDDSLGTRAIFESNGITHFLTQLDFHLFTDTFGDTHCRNTSRLSTSNHSHLSISGFKEKLCELSSFARSSLSNDNGDLIISDYSQEIFSHSKSREQLSLF